ncbi:MAG TPA: class I SAM-dependent methyltransferase [Pseudomonadales bacterium]|nr:class I SAM-dependent methyltransferase [Pseudomonadales bacterium]
MAELNIPRAHSNTWYDNLAQVQRGYYYPWKSVVGPRNGEDAFIEVLQEHLTPGIRVLEVGCGHGDLALRLAPFCASIVAYDRVQSYIDVANDNKQSAGITNVDYRCFDMMDPQFEEPRLPVEDQSVDLIIGRRAPLHWIQDAKRACRPGGLLIELNPMEEPIPAWSSKLPSKLHYENSGRHTGTGSIHQSVENRLHQAGLVLHSGWGFDVPEVFADPREFYTMLSWGLPAAEIPPFEDLETRINGIYERYAEADGIVLRHCRFLWKAVVND